MNLIVTDQSTWADYFSQRTGRAGSKPSTLDGQQEVPNRSEGIWMWQMDGDSKWGRVGEDGRVANTWSQVIL